MKLVADANILFSLAKRSSAASEIASKYRIQLYSPDYVLSELGAHKAEIEDKTGVKYPEIMETLKEKVLYVESQAYDEFLDEALSLIGDPEDAPYLALAMKLRAPIWSNDRHLKDQKRIPVLTTKELVELLTG